VRTGQIVTLGLDTLIDAAIALGEYIVVGRSMRVSSAAESDAITLARQHVEADVRARMRTGERRGRKPSCAAKFSGVWCLT
jgi:hypothetical protein